MDIAISMIAFLGLVASWFVLPASPRTTDVAPATAERLPHAA